MKILKLILIASIVAGFALRTAADVPPEPGFKRVTMNLIVTAESDFPDHRFFLKTGADLKEISLGKGSEQTIEPLGGGAWYRSGTLLAVPRKNLEGLSEETPSGGALSEMRRAVYDGKAAGIIKLIDHSFSRDVSGADASGLNDPVYRIQADPEKGLKAVLVSAGDNKASTGTGISIYSREPKSGLFWGTVAGGSLITLAFIFLGVWFIRRSKAKAMR